MLIWSHASISFLSQRVNSEGDFKTDIRQRHLFALMREWGWLGEIEGKDQ